MDQINSEDIVKVSKVLENENAVLAARFRAVFTLRNIGGKAAKLISLFQVCFCRL